MVLPGLLPEKYNALDLLHILSRVSIFDIIM